MASKIHPEIIIEERMIISEGGIDYGERILVGCGNCDTIFGSDNKRG